MMGSTVSLTIADFAVTDLLRVRVLAPVQVLAWEPAHPAQAEESLEVTEASWEVVAGSEVQEAEAALIEGSYRPIRVIVEPGEACRLGRSGY